MPTLPLPVLPLLAVSAEDVGPAVTLLHTIADELTLPRAFVHASAIMGLSGYLSSNILALRTLAVLSSAFAMCFNLWNRLFSPVYWNITFMSINLGQIVRLLRKSKDHITMTPEQQNLYELAFSRYGVRLREFLDLLAETRAEWIDYPAGATVVHEGDEMPLIWYVIEGTIEARRDRSGNDAHELVKPGKGGWCGELWDPNEAPDYWEQPHHWRTGFFAKENTRVVAFDRKALHDFIARSDHMRNAAEAAEIADLWGKLRGILSQGNRNIYRGMFQMSMADGDLTERERKLLDEFADKNPRDLAELDPVELHTPLKR